MNNQIVSNDGKMDIIVQACDKDWANIKVAYRNPLDRHKYRNGQVQRRIVLSSYSFGKYESKKVYPNQMPLNVYVKYLQQSKKEILELCARLVKRCAF